jgi:hypothetical protein
MDGGLVYVPAGSVEGAKSKIQDGTEIEDLDCIGVR